VIAVALIQQALLAAMLDVSVQPTPLPPGAEATVQVRAEPGRAVRVFASSGDVGPLSEIAPGVFTARYRPLDDGIPRVAILWARTAEGDSGWAPLPVAVEVEATIRGRPRGLGAVTIGSTRFGPVRLDAKGLATVSVVVPPGVTEAISGPRHIPLHVPATATFALAMDKEEGHADVEERVEVSLFATTQEGAPREGAEFELTVDRGRIDAVRRVSVGEYRTSWTLPPGAEGEATIAAALRDHPELKETARILLRPGPAAQIRFAGATAALVAGTSGARLQVSARDRAGNPSPRPLRFESSFGAIAAESSGAGEWNVRLEVPAHFAGRTSVRVVARGDSDASVEILLAPGPPAHVEMTTGPVARADPERPIDVRLAVTDEYGNAVQASPTLQVDAGVVSPLAEQDGSYLATWRPPLSREYGRASLVATAGSARAERDVELLPHEHLLVLSPQLGFLSNFSDVTSPVVALEAALRSDRFGPSLEVLGELAWSFSSVSSPAAISSSSSVGVRSRTDYLTATLAAGGFLPITERTRGFLHAGPTLSRVSSSLQLGSQPETSGAALVPGFQLTIGIERRMWGTTPFLEVRGAISADPALEGVLSGSTRSLGLNAGARIELL
jgi:hypothetical protein